MYVKWLSLLIILCIIKATVCQNLTHYKKLHNDLFNDYNPDITPFDTENGNSNKKWIKFQFYNLGINHYDEVDGILSLTAMTILTWMDSSLRWKPSDFNNITQITVYTGTVWFPYIILLNDANKLEPFDSTSPSKVSISYNGNIDWSPTHVINSKCPANMRKFPFDEQKCSLTFLVWEPSKQIYLEPVSMPYSDYFEAKSPDWIVQSWEVTPDKQGNISLAVVLNIKREPLYYIILVFTPIAVLALLNPLVFLLPQNSGERISYGMTILLSFVVFLTLASDKIPATSNPISFLIVFIVLVFIASAVILLFNIFNCYFFHKKDKEIKGFLKNIAKILCRKERKEKFSANDEITIFYKDIAL
ncbi:acetylcholine receptor subunit beta-type lev-1-like [Mytilus trossulus]|uniref:acetylcholine receptor subunit beta-type lev-1-like n=1 Tax=Mytilus trossulus TaxID=6551 RepID=UPI003007C208